MYGAYCYSKLKDSTFGGLLSIYVNPTSFMFIHLVHKGIVVGLSLALFKVLLDYDNDLGLFSQSCTNIFCSMQIFIIVPVIPDIRKTTHKQQNLHTSFYSPKKSKWYA